MLSALISQPTSVRTFEEADVTLVVAGNVAEESGLLRSVAG